MNNAGLGPIDGVPEYLEEQPPQFIIDLVTINCLMPTMVGAGCTRHCTYPGVCQWACQTIST